MNLPNEKRNLPVKLTPDELRTRGRKLAGLREDVAIAKAAAKAAAKSAKTVIDGLELEAEEVGKAITTGVEYVEVECIWQVWSETNTMRLVRADTSEVVKERAMTAEERQQELVLEARHEEKKKGRKGFPKGGKGRLEDIPAHEAAATDKAAGVDDDDAFDEEA